MSQDKSTPANLQTDILREQVRLAVWQIPFMQIASYIVAVILTVVSWNFVPRINAIFLKEIAISLPNLIITDLDMPNIDGINLIKSLKGNSRFSKIPIIVATSSPLKPGQESYRELKTVGVSDIVIKPVVEENFLPPIKRLL